MCAKREHLNTGLMAICYGKNAIKFKRDSLRLVEVICGKGLKNVHSVIKPGPKNARLVAKTNVEIH